MQNRKRDTDVQNRVLDCGRRQGCDDLREQHQNLYIIYGETDHQPRLDAWDKLRAGALGRPREIGWRGKWDGGLGWGIHVNPWLIHVNVWQKPLQYCKVINLQLIKINEKKVKYLENKIQTFIKAYNQKSCFSVVRKNKNKTLKN